MKPLLEISPARRPAYYWWMLANALAACFAVLSWVVCLEVFGNIEVPRNYELLEKIGRLPERRAITAEQAPDGDALTPTELYKTYFALGDKELAKTNGKLLRNYLNSSNNPLLLKYVEGDFRVHSVRQLTDKDFMNPGFVVSAQALVKPSEDSPQAPYPVWIEQVFPNAPPEAAALFEKGNVLEIRKSPGCVSVIHVAKVKMDGMDTLCFTVVPVITGPYQEQGSKRAFEIGLPEKIRPRVGLPILNNP